MYPHTLLLGARSLGAILSMIIYSTALCSQVVNVKRMFVPLVLICTLASSTIVSAHFNCTNANITCPNVFNGYIGILSPMCDWNTLNISRNGTTWIGNSSTLVLAVHYHCPYGYCKKEETTFSLEYQDEQCTDNHTGVLCGGCKTDMSALLGSTHCKACTNQHLWVLLPITILGVVLVTLLFLLNFTVSVGTLNGLILYANIIRPGIIDFINTNNDEDYSKANFLIVFIDWLNLDFGIETCFYKDMSRYGKTWLELLFPVYILALVGAIIMGSRWSSTLAWLSKRNAIPVLATLVLLSYTQCLQNVTTIFSSTQLHTGNNLCINSTVRVWLADGNIPYVQGEHIPLFIAGVIITAVFILPYTSLFLLSPWLQTKSHWKVFRWVNKLKPFIDAHQAPFKDQYRYWPGVHLMVRVVLYLVFASNPTNHITINLLAILLVVVLYTVIANHLSVYKNSALLITETFYMINVTFLAAAMLYIHAEDSKCNYFTMTTSTNRCNAATLIPVVLSTASVLFVFSLAVVFHAYQYLIMNMESCISVIQKLHLGRPPNTNTAVWYQQAAGTPVIIAVDEPMYFDANLREPMLED